MGSRGKALSENQVRKIVSLLASTELTVPEIAERMGCSRSTVVSVNRFHGIRDYQGHRSVWVCNTSATGTNAAPVQVTMPAPVVVKSVEAPGASR